MEIEELVNDLSFDVFQELRRKVIKRHQVHAMQVAGIIEYLVHEKPDICTSVESGDKDDFCANSLSQLFQGIPVEICLRAVTRYRELKDMEEKAKELNTKGEEK